MLGVVGLVVVLAIWGGSQETPTKRSTVNNSTPVTSLSGSGSDDSYSSSSSSYESSGETNAREKGESYLRYTAFSREGLIDQLEYEGFTTAEATYAVDAITVDWNEQAALKAASYLDHQSFSRSGLQEQLEYEGFTPAQAAHGVSVAY